MPSPCTPSDISQHRRSSLPAPVPSAPLLAFLAGLAAAVAPAAAHPARPLDFLAPRELLHDAQSAEKQEPKRRRRSAPRRRQSTSRRRTHNNIAVREDEAVDVRDTVPRKYERVDSGWVLAEEWALHGKRRSEDISIVIPDELQGVHVDSITSDALDLPKGWEQDDQSRHTKYDPTMVAIFALILACSIVATITFSVWRANRHRKQEAEDVEKAAAVQKKKRRRMPPTIQDDTQSQREDEEEGDATDVDDDDEKSVKAPTVASAKSQSKSKGPRSSRVFGKSSALWRANSRLAARLRRRHTTQFAPDRDTSASLPPTTTPAAIVTEILAAVAANSGSDSRSMPISVPTASHDTAALGRPDQNSSTPTAGVTRLVNTAEGPAAPDPSSSSVAVPLASVDANAASSRDDEQTVQPPAYRRGPRVQIPVRRHGKEPLRGLEAEYDGRDIARWRQQQRHSLLHAADPDAPSGSHVDGIPQDDDEIPLSPPPDLESEDASSRSTHHASRAGHLATDEKSALERLRNLRQDAPMLSPEVLGTATAQEAPSLIPMAMVPEFIVVEEWDTEQQLIDTTSSASTLSITSTPRPPLHHGTSSSFSASSSHAFLPSSPSLALSPSSNRLPPPPSPIHRTQTTLLPAPSSSQHPLIQTISSPSLAYAVDVSQGYGLSSLWRRFGTSRSDNLPPGPATPSVLETRVAPSAPPAFAFEDDDVETPGLVSLGASAPPLWEDDLDDGQVAETSSAAAHRSSSRDHGEPGSSRMDVVDDARSPALQQQLPALHNSRHYDLVVQGDSPPLPQSPAADDEGSRLGMRSTRRIDGVGLPRYEP